MENNYNNNDNKDGYHMDNKNLGGPRVFIFYRMFLKKKLFKKKLFKI